jgi:hypothetical protein
MSLTGLAGVRIGEIRSAQTALAEADSETASSEGAREDREWVRRDARS